MFLATLTTLFSTGLQKKDAKKLVIVAKNFAYESCIKNFRLK